MTRLNLLRHLPGTGVPVANPGEARSEAGGILKPALFILLGLLVAGAVTAYLVAPEWPGFEKLRQAASREEPPQPPQAWKDKAARLVLEGQTAAIDWLYELESLSPPDSEGFGFSLAVFTPPAEFLLRGSARTEEDLSRVQESLALLPGIDLRQSRAARTGEGGVFIFQFAGSIAFREPDSLAGGNRVVTDSGFRAEVEAFVTEAARFGLEVSPPAPVAASSETGARSLRLRAVCGPSGWGGLRALLESERHRESPLGMQRVTLESRNGEKTAFLDIMAFVF